MTATSIVAKAATVTLYALAALPFLAISMAHAEPASVKISDLDFSSPAHVAVFEDRVDHAANKLCASYAEPREMTMSAACRSAVQSEARDKLTMVEAQAAVTSLASR
jgi:UrcA family protein